MDADNPSSEKPSKSSKLALLIGGAFFIAGAGGGFFLLDGNLLQGQENAHTSQDDTEAAHENVAFVPLEPLLISLHADGRTRHLRFSAQVEVAYDSVKYVEGLKPRIVDALNSYLRAVQIADLEQSNSLLLLRSQILYRINLIVGEEHVKDLLIMEFVLN